MVTLKDAIAEKRNWLFIRSLKPKGENRNILDTDSCTKEKILKRLLEHKGPFVFVDKKGEVFLNETAKKYAIEGEIREEVELLVEFGYLVPPQLFCLSSNLKELSEMMHGSNMKTIAYGGRGGEERRK